MTSLTITEKVSVVFEDYPKFVRWRGKIYKITKLGFHHSYWEGKIFYHIFSVVSDTLFFRLKLNTQNLLWLLEEVENGL